MIFLKGDIDRIFIKSFLILTKLNFFFFFFLPSCWACGNSGLQPRIEPWAMAMKARNPNHQAIRELPPNLKILIVNLIYIYAPVNYLENTGKRKKKKIRCHPNIQRYSLNILMLPSFFLHSHIFIHEVCICFKMKQMHTIRRVLYSASFFWHYHEYLRYTLSLNIL